MTLAQRPPAGASILGAGGDPQARIAEHAHHVEAEVGRAAVSQLLAGGPLAESLHILLVLIVAVLVWNSLPLELTIGWVGAVAAAAGLRTWWRLGVRRRRRHPCPSAARGCAHPGRARRDRRGRHQHVGR